MGRTVFTAGMDAQGKRFDVFVASESGLSRAQVQKLIKSGMVLVNSRPAKANHRIQRGDAVELTLTEEPEGTIMPQDIPVDILYEDEHIVVINKRAGMVVHPGAGNRSGTIVNALLARCGGLASIGAPLRPGVVHRLDKDTSGVMVFAKKDDAYRDLAKQFKERLVDKRYVTLLYGNLKNETGEIRAPIGRAVSDRKKMTTRTAGGREAVTRYEVMKRFRSATLAKVRIITGRTHQVRVHFAALGHPVLGDRTYGRKTSLKYTNMTVVFSRQMLHAYSLKFRHPGTGDILECTAPIPEDIKRAVTELGEIK